MAGVLPPRPLTDDDDCGSFDCGRESLNAWFRRHAWSNNISGVSRVTVLTCAETGRIAAYVALSAGQIERAFLPKPQQRNRSDPVPVTLLGQLAVDKAYQGQGHAKSLLLFALKTALRAADIVGSTGVITHPLDDGARRFYTRWGFQDLPFDPQRGMIVRIADLRASFMARGDS